MSNVDILEIEAKLVIGETVYYHGGIPCGSLNWYDRDTSQKIDLNGRINRLGLDEGEYKITIVVEKL